MMDEEIKIKIIKKKNDFLLLFKTTIITMGMIIF